MEVRELLELAKGGLQAGLEIAHSITSLGASSPDCMDNPSLDASPLILSLPKGQQIPPLILSLSKDRFTMRECPRTTNIL